MVGYVCENGYICNLNGIRYENNYPTTKHSME